MLAKIEPFWSWLTPIAWTGYILFVDGWIWHRRGESPISNDRAEMVFLALVSVPLWTIFEQYNKHALFNWHYVGLPETLLVRYFGYLWAFATIWPAVLITAEAVGAIRDRRAPAYRRLDPARIPLDAIAWTCWTRSTPSTAPSRCGAICAPAIRGGWSISWVPGSCAA